MKIVGQRVDGLTLAYRTTLDPSFVKALRERSRIANKYGRAGFEWQNRVSEGVAGVGPARMPRKFHHEPPSISSGYVRGMWGELKFSDRASCWTLTNQPFFRMMVRLHAPGAVERVNDVTGERDDEGGWTIEIVFYAQWLAEVGLEAAIREGEAIASLCGDVHERRLRRIDLCADIQGWRIREGDVRRLVKRPRARWQKEYGDVGVGPGGVVVPLRLDDKELAPRRATKEERQEAVRAQDFGRGALDRRQITGVSVGRGGAMMCRCYDKRAELERDEERRVNEERRWRHTAGCPDLASLDPKALRDLDEQRGECPHCRLWDGLTRVTRVEFQIRGTVIREFGLLDPEVALEVETALDDRGRARVVGHKRMVDADGVVLGLADRLDWLWRSCLEWARLVVLDRTATGKLKPVSRLPDDPRWAFLRTVTFADARAPSIIKRYRVRAAASAAMGLGVALAQAGRDGELVRLPENSGAYDERTAESELRERVAGLMTSAGGKIVEMLLQKYGGSAIEACVHLAVRSNAAMLRFRERRIADAHHATDPPDGFGAWSSSPSGGGRPDPTGAGEESRAVA